MTEKEYFKNEKLRGFPVLSLYINIHEVNQFPLSPFPFKRWNIDFL
jgi:hypothetical protein